MSKSSRCSSSSSSSSFSCSSGNVKLSKVAAAIPRAFVSLAKPAAISASVQPSATNVRMVRPASFSVTVLPSAAVSLIRPAQSPKSAKPIGAQSSLASSPADILGRRSQTGKTKAGKGSGKLPAAAIVPSDSPSTIMSSTNEALSQPRSHSSDVGRFDIISYIDLKPILSEGPPESGLAEVPDTIQSAPNSDGDNEESDFGQPVGRGEELDDGQPALVKETAVEVDINLDRYIRLVQLNRLNKRRQRPSEDVELVEKRDDKRTDPRSQYERGADPQSLNSSLNVRRQYRSPDDSRDSHCYHDYEVMKFQA